MTKGTFVPLYKKIYEDIRNGIASGQYPPGSRLPFESELCETYNVQRITVRHALDLLLQEGAIEKQPGKGSYVKPAEPAAEQPGESNGTLLFLMSKSPNDILSNTSTHTSQLFFTMEQLCRLVHYDLLYTGIESVADLTNITQRYHISGVFIVSTVPQSFIDAVVGLGLPSVCVNHFDERMICVLPDNTSGIAQAVEHLTALGHKRIAFVEGTKASFNSGERKATFVSALARRGIVPRNELMLSGEWTFPGSRDAVAEMLSTLPAEERPTALLAASDMMAIGAMDAITSAGLSIPEDISVMGFDNIELTHYCTPQLTSVGPSSTQMAKVALGHLLQLIKNGFTPDDRYIIRLPNTFAVRASTARVK